MYISEKESMEQKKLFYNICNALWAFAKTLDKESNVMLVKDWEETIYLMEKNSR